MNRFFVLSILMLLGIVACTRKQKKPKVRMDAYKRFVKSAEISSDFDDNKEKLKMAGFSFGTILDKSNIDGCSFVIITEDSTTFEPLKLDSAFSKNDLNVAFRFRPSRAMTTCMMGKPISILEMRNFKK